MAVQTRTVKCPPLLALLSDGQVHSGEALARRLEMSRTGIWKSIARLRAQGVEVLAIPRAGYRLPQAVELLDAGEIKRAIAAARLKAVKELQVHYALDSTNTYLLDTADDGKPGMRARIVLAELQTAGRGRRGRSWLAPFGAGIALSVAWNFPETPRDLPALSLAVGVAIARALARLGASDVKLKWPNDIWWNDCKLGGVLIELRAEASGPAMVVIGIGINLNLPRAVQAVIERDGVTPASLMDACPKASRNAVAGAIIDETLRVLNEFTSEGFAPFRAEWLKLDALVKRPVSVLLGEKRIAGTAAGIDRDGGFILRHGLGRDGGVGGSDGFQESKFISGEVSLRLREERA